MPMPLWVMFSPLNCDARALMLDILPDFLAVYRMRPFYTMPIEREDDEIVYLDAEGRKTEDLSAMLAAETGKLGVDLTFFIPEVRRYVRFSILDREKPSALCLSIPCEILGVDHDKFGKSGWVVNFISKLANKLGSECCLSARDDQFSQVLESLNVVEVLDQLKSGHLLGSVPPVILVVREDLAGAEELAKLVNTWPELGFQLEHDGACHVLWSMQNS